jgi:hypothetical protein
MRLRVEAVLLFSCILAKASGLRPGVRQGDHFVWEHMKDRAAGVSGVTGEIIPGIALEPIVSTELTC